MFAGGGVGGIAWLVGVLAALADSGVDVGLADRLVGTSAGSAVATQLATGQLDAAERMQQDERTSEIAVSFDVEQFLAAMAEASRAATTRQDASRRIANLPLANTSATAEQRRAAVLARLPVLDWPERALHIVAVARDTGERVVFDRTSGVSLADAVVASCAVPGIWPPVTIGGREFVDGGVHSFSNADLAAGAHRTLILVPGLVDANQLALLDTETNALHPGTAHVLRADVDALDAIGPNPLDPSRRPAAYAAGRAQAERVRHQVAAYWL